MSALARSNSRSAQTPWKNVDKCHALRSTRRREPGRRERRQGVGIGERREREKCDRTATGIDSIVPTPLSDRQMVLAFLFGLCVAFAAGLRGPHHPKSTVSHHHYSPQKDVKLTQDTELLRDATHLKEDMGPIASQLDFSKMSEQEIEFHYFKVHDIDNNTKLDGLEILHAIQHTLHEHDSAANESKDSEEDGERTRHEDDLPWIIDFIDRVLEEDDLDNDGYLGYVEYVLGRQKDHIAQAKRTGRSTF